MGAKLVDCAGKEAEEEAVPKKEVIEEKEEYGKQKELNSG